MTKLILYILALMMLVPPVFAANAELSIADVSGATGSNVEIPINLKSNVGIGSIDVVVSFDPTILKFDSVDKGSLSGNSMIDYNTKNSGNVAIAMADSQGLKGEGSVAVLKFTVLGKQGDTSIVKIESSSANEAATLVDVRLDTRAGNFSVTGGTGMTGIIAVAAVVILVVIVLVIKRKGSKPK